MERPDNGDIFQRRAPLRVAALIHARGPVEQRRRCARPRPAGIRCGEPQERLDDADAQYQRDAGDKVVVSYGASSALAKQIENGAPADIFISADLDWMDYVAEHKLIKPDTRFNLLGNKLVLIAPADSRDQSDHRAEFSARAGARQRPPGDGGALRGAGRQIRQGGARGAGVWASVAGKIAPAQDVRAHLAAGVARRGALGHRLPDRCGLR